MEKKEYIKPRATLIDLSNESLLAGSYTIEPEYTKVTASYAGDDNGSNGDTPEAETKSVGRIIWD